MTLYLLSAGIVSGMAMGLIGIGGGAILMPLLMFSGLTLEQSVTIILFAQIIPQTLPAFWKYYQKGHFLFKECMVTLVGSFIGVSVGAWLATNEVIPKKILYQLMSLTLMFFAVWIWVKYCN